MPLIHPTQSRAFRRNLETLPSDDRGGPLMTHRTCTRTASILYALLVAGLCLGCPAQIDELVIVDQYGVDGRLTRTYLVSNVRPIPGEDEGGVF